MADYSYRRETRLRKRVLLGLLGLAVASIGAIGVMFFYQLQSETVGDLADAPLSQATPSNQDQSEVVEDSFFESASESSELESQKIFDEQRRQDIDTIQQQLEAYFAQHEAYPDINDMNSDRFRETAFTDVDQEIFKDPEDETGRGGFTRTPQKNVYSYWPVDVNDNACEPIDRVCVAYELAATLSDDTIYSVQSP